MPQPAPAPEVEDSLPIVEEPVVEEIPVAVVEDTIQVPTPDAPYEEGMVAYEAGNGLEAIRAFNRSSYPEAYYMLGIIYEQGCGSIGKNPILARRNFKKAAQLGSEVAKTKL